VPGLPDNPFRISYGPTDDRLNSFYIQALSCSVNYFRSAGFFSSSALAIAAAGISRLIKNGGKMRLLVGAQLTEDDVEAVRKGHAVPRIVGDKMLAAFPDPGNLFTKKRLEALAWMVADGTLEIKVVLPTDEHGVPLPAHLSHDYYHTKEGIFTDANGNQVGFSGSVNESEQAWLHNYEQFMVFCSWLPGQKPFLDEISQRLNRLWEAKEEHWLAIPIPSAVRDRLICLRPERVPDDDTYVGSILPDEETKIQQAPLSDAERDKILFQFVRDAPFLPNATRLGFDTATVKPWPHQGGVAGSIVDLYPDSFLLSDEVGLGKTAEVGLALRQLYISGRVKRVLILVPKSVARQWQEELYEKFSLNTPLYDGRDYQDIFRRPMPADAENPWNSYPVILASSQLVKRRDRQAELLDAKPWDMVIVDEAHHARRREFNNQPFRPNRLMELLVGTRGRPGLQSITKSVILLTATPMQVNPVEVFDLLRVLGLGGRWGAEDNFLRFFSELRGTVEHFAEADWRFILAMMKDFLEAGGSLDPEFERQAEERLGPVGWKQIQGLPSSPRWEAVLRRASTDERAVLVEMAKRHTPLRKFMFRNTRRLLREYQKKGILKERIPDREPRLVWIELTGPEQDIYDRIDEYISDFYQRYEAERRGLGFIMTVYRRRLTSSFHAMQCSLERRLAFLRGETTNQGYTDDDVEQDDLQKDVTEDEVSGVQDALHQEEIRYVEDYLSQLRHLGSDTKAERLIEDINSLLGRRETLIVFTQYTDTMDYLRDRLKEVYGSHVACYSGRGGETWNSSEWVLTTKEFIKAAFRKGEEVKILLCTEAASEGLNLQTCGVLINYDVPWNPMRVEQRIGRIDRIGQVHEKVWILNYFYKNTVEADIYSACSDRINWFETVIGELQPILSRVERAIQAAAMTKGESRLRCLEEEVFSLREEIDRRKAEGINIDEYTLSGMSAGGGVLSPLTLPQLQHLMTDTILLPGVFRPHPVIEDAYTVMWKGTEYTATFRPDVFDKHPNTVRLLTYGEVVFEDIMDAIPPPGIDLNDAGLTKRSAKTPYDLVSFYRIGENGAVETITSLGSMKNLLTKTPRPELRAEKMSEVDLDFAEIVRKMSNKVSVQEETRKRTRRMSLEEEGRNLLVRATYLRLSMTQQTPLFEEAFPLDFSDAAVKRLAKLGYPFAGLLRLIDVDGVYLSPTEPTFIEMQKQNPTTLNRKFGAIIEQGKTLLSALSEV
jgi:superfamily II DNA or RNA helicase